MLQHCETKLNLFGSFSIDSQYQILSNSVLQFQSRKLYSYKPHLYIVTLHTLPQQYLKLQVNGIFGSSELLVPLSIPYFVHCSLAFFLSLHHFKNVFPLSHVMEGWFLLSFTCQKNLLTPCISCGKQNYFNDISTYFTFISHTHIYICIHTLQGM